jgi:5-methylcytosine-specific restriction endonuclease McrA
VARSYANFVKTQDISIAFSCISMSITFMKNQIASVSAKQTWKERRERIAATGEYEKLSDEENKRRHIASVIACRDRNPDKYLDYMREYNKKRKEADPEYARKVRDYQAAYRRKNAEKKREYHAVYHSKNREKRLQSFKDYAVKNAVTEKARKKKYYDENSAALLQQKHKYWLENKDRIKARIKANPGPTRRGWEKRRALKADATVGDLRLITEWEKSWRSKRFTKCFWCGNRVTPKSCHKDHITPLSKGGAHSVENLCVSCGPCNVSKHAKDVPTWNKHLAAPVLL